jgi:hypothetical protein
MHLTKTKKMTSKSQTVDEYWKSYSEDFLRSKPLGLAMSFKG